MLIQRLLFLLTMFVAIMLAATVLLAPFFDPLETEPHIWGRLLAVFARDAVVRRTSLASALGLAVTARVFFRPHFFRARPNRTGNNKLSSGNFADA